MKNIGQILREAIDKKGLTCKKVGLLIGVSESSVNHWVNNRRKPREPEIRKLADVLNVSYDELFGEKISVKRIKIVGTASCGGLEENHLQETGGYALFNGEEYQDRYYCVVANGESMAPEIDDGDEVICDPEAPIQSGDMVHYSIGNESAIKVYFKDEDAYIAQFVPYNQTEHFKTKTIRLEEFDVKMAKVISVNKKKTNNRLARLKLINKL